MDLDKRKILTETSTRPMCDMPGCNRYADHLGHYRKDGSTRWRRYPEIGFVCKHCHEAIMKTRRQCKTNTRPITDFIL